VKELPKLSAKRYFVAEHTDTGKLGVWDSHEEKFMSNRDGRIIAVVHRQVAEVMSDVLNAHWISGGGK
jgi:hypothetical protein